MSVTGRIAEACARHRFRDVRWTTVGVTDDEAAAVDVVARYIDADGGVSLVSSCDVYEFANGRLTAITSDAVELGPESSDTGGFDVG